MYDFNWFLANLVRNLLEFVAGTNSRSQHMDYYKLVYILSGTSRSKSKSIIKMEHHKTLVIVSEYESGSFILIVAYA